MPHPNITEYCFGVQRGRLSEKEQKRRKRIARRHGANFVYADIPGDGWKSWFTCPNRGEPFDGATRRAVMADVEGEQ